ncbi:TadE family type IV pilus minor pilin [Streptomyces sp. 549]|uniref:TadE family type IV pilus minor pilin n=1 Tax=Streptomyces sp. 549 TaxID=3049076 RepID=UPI0032E35DB8
MRGSEPWRRDSGQSTAETAVVVPCLVLLLAVLLWGLLAMGSKIQCLDAARAGARAAARAEDAQQVLSAAREVAPRGARVLVEREGPLVRVQVTARSVGPGPLSAEVHGEAVARAERPTSLFPLAVPDRSTDPDPGPDPDSGLGSAPGPGPHAGADAQPDGAPDARPDARPDAQPDARPNVEPSRGPRGGPDVGPSGAVEPAPPESATAR